MLFLAGCGEDKAFIAPSENVVVIDREAPVASMSHILRKLNDYGYEITFAYTILQSFP